MWPGAAVLRPSDLCPGVDLPDSLLSAERRAERTHGSLLHVPHGDMKRTTSSDD